MHPKCLLHHPNYQIDGCHKFSLNCLTKYANQTLRKNCITQAQNIAMVSEHVPL